MCWWVISPFCIFAVLDVSLAINLSINCSFYIYLKSKASGFDIEYFTFLKNKGEYCRVLKIGLALTYLLLPATPLSEKTAVSSVVLNVGL